MVILGLVLLFKVESVGKDIETTFCQRMSKFTMLEISSTEKIGSHTLGFLMI